MSRIIMELPGGGYAAGADILSAMVWEAGRRGTSYGKLMANTTRNERKEIVCAYCLENWKKEKRRRKSREKPSVAKNQN